MVSKDCPRRVWDFGLKNVTNVIHMIPSEKLNVRTPIEAVTVETPDISEYVEFYLYDLVWYHAGNHPRVIKEHHRLGQWKGLARRVGIDM